MYGGCLWSLHKYQLFLNTCMSTTENWHGIAVVTGYFENNHFLLQWWNISAGLLHKWHGIQWANSVYQALMSLISRPGNEARFSFACLHVILVIRLTSKEKTSNHKLHLFFFLTLKNTPYWWGGDKSFFWNCYLLLKVLLSNYLWWPSITFLLPGGCYDFSPDHLPADKEFSLHFIIFISHSVWVSPKPMPQWIDI